MAGSEQWEEEELERQGLQIKIELENLLARAGEIEEMAGRRRRRIRSKRRVILLFTSWLAATMEMREEVQGRPRKAYQPLLPSQGRLTNMAMGP